MKNNKIKEWIEKLNEFEKEDLEALRDIIVKGELLKDLEVIINIKSGKNCSVCGGIIENDYYEIRWMSNGLLKRAKFDGLDCLAYFIAALRNRKEERIKKRVK